MFLTTKIFLIYIQYKNKIFILFLYKSKNVQKAKTTTTNEKRK